MTDELSELYPELIRDHDRKPHNFHALPGANRSAEGNNPFCGDHYAVFIKLEGGVIQDISFQGAGCMYSKASASMMTDLLKGKSVAEAEKIFAQFREMVMTGSADEEAMGKLCAFACVRRVPMRVKCAILPWHAMMAALKGQAVVSTEEK
jgi:nitrogen fixation NifU-like protein